MLKFSGFADLTSRLGATTRSKDRDAARRTTPTYSWNL